MRDVDMALAMSSAHIALVIQALTLSAQFLVPNLRADVLRLVDFAVASLAQKSRVRKRADRQCSRGHHPGLRQRRGVVDSDFVQNLIALTSKFFDHVHLIGMEETAA